MDGPGIITINGVKEEEHIKLNFTDTGPGFPLDSIENMFDPFFTTKDNGTGLGLPIVKSIINSHNGIISLENTDEGNAQVNIDFLLTKPDNNT